MSLHLISQIKKVRDLLTSVCSKTYHYEAPEKNTANEYIVWQEDGEADSLHADNSKSEQVIQLSINLYTKTEYSTLIDTLQNLFADSMVSFSLVSVTFETETKFIHYEWQCEI